MSEFAAEAVQRIQQAFEQHGDPGRARQMAAYMRNLFPFVGIPTSERRRLLREGLAGLPRPSEAELITVVLALWELPEREYQYAATDMLIRNVRACGPGFLAVTKHLITTQSWWDTVDALASKVVGPLAAAYPELRTELDGWIGDSDPWVARSAILYQLGYKSRTDAARLLSYCLRRASDREFFIRKAAGWALREYSKTDGAAVTAFVEANASVLSPLTRREALLWLNRGRARGAAAP